MERQNRRFEMERDGNVFISSSGHVPFDIQLDKLSPIPCYRGGRNYYDITIRDHGAIYMAYFHVDIPSKFCSKSYHAYLSLLGQEKHGTKAYFEYLKWILKFQEENEPWDLVPETEENVFTKITEFYNELFTASALRPVQLSASPTRALYGKSPWRLQSDE
jgi:hypothetical protein